MNWTSVEVKGGSDFTKLKQPTVLDQTQNLQD